jgi:hypothetical protein
MANAATRKPQIGYVSPERLGELAVNAGLAGWIEDKVS